MADDPTESAAVGADARELNEQPLLARARITAAHGRRLAGGVGLFLVVFWLLVTVVVPPYLPSEAETVSILPGVVVTAFVFETLDSAAGMGFGATVGTVLFLLGYPPDAVVPVLLLSEAVTGLVGGLFHNEFNNVAFGFAGGRRSPTEATAVLGIITTAGVAAVAVSVGLSYYALALPDVVIKLYVASIIAVIALVTLFKRVLDPATEYRRRRLIAFAVLAGANKGVAGSGYGPVVTIGSILSGVYEKSATAITTMAEGVVSLAGIGAFFLISAAGYELHLLLLPSVFAGGFFAAILAPYTVRVLPNRVLGYLVPVYALVLAGGLLLQVR